VRYFQRGWGQSYGGRPHVGVFPMKLTSIPLTLLAILSLLVLFALFLGCENGGGPSPNLLPHVSVTGGPPEGGVSSYHVTISWAAWDEDGVVKYFLYAIDDTTRWTEIRALEQTFLFTADSLREGEEFGRWHTFWVKAVDNDGAKSVPDYLTFDARTVAPKTTIISPDAIPKSRSATTPLVPGLRSGSSGTAKTRTARCRGRSRWPISGGFSISRLSSEAILPATMLHTWKTS